MPIWLSDTRPKARKPHTCQLCFRMIEPGEKYIRQAVIGDDGPYTFKACEHCETYSSLIDLLGQMADPWEGYTAEDLIEYRPRNMEEARWFVQHRRKWRRRDGSLYSVPAALREAL